MHDPRTGFARIPAEPATGQVRLFPTFTSRPAGDDLDASDALLVRHAGRNHVFASPEALEDAIAQAAQAARRAAFDRAPLAARLHFELAALREDLLFGLIVGVGLCAVELRLALKLFEALS